MGMWDYESDDDWSQGSDIDWRFNLMQAMKHMHLLNLGLHGDIFSASSIYNPAGVQPLLPSVDVITLPDLQKTRHEGNRFFAEQNWAAAANMYSRCISQALRKLDNDVSTRTASHEDINHVLMLTYSNRAEASLRLQHFEDALSDAEEALKIQPKHVKTLLRKGRAARGLRFFEKACKAFEVALEESPEEKSIETILAASRTALKQSQTGAYNLSDYFLRRCAGEAPSCADFIGPVEIRRVGYGHGRRGLFATRSVKAGDLLLVSNPLVALKQKVPNATLGPMTTFFDHNSEISLVSELAKRIRTSKRQMTHLYSLCSHAVGEMEIPSMERFRSESEWVPESDLDKFEVDVGRIMQIVGLNAVRSIKTHDLNTHIITAGIWTLPSFANHSCSPNVVKARVGDAAFFRAGVDIVQGEELTVSYLDELCLPVRARQAHLTKTWLFKCKCARCLLEETLEQNLSKVGKEFNDMNDTVKAAGSEFRHQYEVKMRIAKGFDKLVDELELVLRSKDSKEQGWIRASFLLAYCAKFMRVTNESGLNRILSIILDSTTPVCIGPTALTFAAFLLDLVERTNSKHSESYRLTLDRVLGIYRLYFGEQPKGILMKLISPVYGDVALNCWIRQVWDDVP